MQLLLDLQRRGRGQAEEARHTHIHTILHYDLTIWSSFMQVSFGTCSLNLLSKQDMIFFAQTANILTDPGKQVKILFWASHLLRGCIVWNLSLNGIQTKQVQPS